MRVRKRKRISSDLDHGYLAYVKQLVGASHGTDVAMRLAIGGEFEAIGLMQRDLLVAKGLRPDGFVIDVGCGSGRLALPLSSYLSGRYLGTDVVPDLLEYARELVGRPDWRFELADGLKIPARNSTADIVCFFSVFTHLRHEESYRYLEEAKRVLRRDGRIVFSFLEFALLSHWLVFEKDVQEAGFDHPLNQFISRDGIQAWADHLGLEVLEILDGDIPNIPLSQPILEHGFRYEEFGPLGQSVAVLAFPGQGSEAAVGAQGS
jgi:SAM-dependent methyltransferase